MRAASIAASPHGEAGKIGARAERALLLELFTHPKPGLVSHVDHGSHADMDAELFARSAAAIRPFLDELARAGRRLAPMHELRRIGIEAEAAMMVATGGVNTHRGAVFGLGLLCAAAGARAWRTDLSLGIIVRCVWGDAILRSPVVAHSHGTIALRRHGGGGAREEAGSGFASVYRIGLPALADGARLGNGDQEAARIQCLFALLARVNDTALLHRGGAAGLEFAQEAARDFLAKGGVGRAGWRDDALRLHRQFVSRGLSAGGCADLLAMTLFVDMMTQGELRA